MFDVLFRNHRREQGAGQALEPGEKIVILQGVGLVQACDEKSAVGIEMDKSQFRQRPTRLPDRAATYR